MAPQPLRALSAAALALIAALALTWATASAQEPTVANTGTTLHPGANLIGWVGETAPVSQLFRDIPQLEAVWAWDAELDEWIVAGRNAPEGLGWLWQVTPGMGLYMILNGDQPFRWQRSTEPTRGLVELRTGWNLVAWSGASETPIDDATKGIGWSLREVRRHNAENQQWTAWTSAERTAQLIATTTDQSEETETPTIQRGEALWINVARAVHWLQPTDILPRLVFPGGASDELQSRVREDLESVLAFFRTQYGIQANPDFTVYIPKDVDALIQAERDDDEEIDDAREADIHDLWDRHFGIASSRRIWVKQSGWPDDLSTGDIARGRYYLTHEYFHVIQFQLKEYSASQWLVEGTADWAGGEHQVLDGERTLQDLREREQSELSSHTPTLRGTESENDDWEYTLGWLATDQLTTTVGSDSWLEFWRWTVPAGPYSHWIRTLHWHTAFDETFGFSVSDFYAEFDAEQREWAAANGGPQLANDDDARWIRGHVIDEGDTPVAGVPVDMIRHGGWEGADWHQQVRTGVGGAFTIRVPGDGGYELSVSEGCERYYSDDDWAIGTRGALTMTVAAKNIVYLTGFDFHDSEIRLSSYTCIVDLSARGRVTGAAGQPLGGVSFAICELSCDRVVASGFTEPDGSFARTLFGGYPTTDYRLRLDSQNDCSVWYRAGGIATRLASASPISTIEGDSTILQVRVPEGACAYQIRGAITKSNGQPLADVSISACSATDGECIERNTDATGSFAITVPAEGSYRLGVAPTADCSAYFGREQMTPRYSRARLFNVAGQDLRLALQVPATLCDLHINGRLVGTDGAPLVDIYASACSEASGICDEVRTGANGSFTITIPLDGRYRVGFLLPSEGKRCTVYFGQERLTTKRSDAWFFDVAGTGIRLPQRQVPTGICDG